MVVWYEKIRKLDIYRYAAPLRAVVCGIALGGASYGGLYLYRLFQNRAAQKVVGLYLEDFRKELQKPEADIGRIATQFGNAGQELSSTSIAPYCFAFQAQALFEKGDLAAGIQALQKAVESLPAQSPLFYLFKTKLALALLDAQDRGESADQGLSMLTDVARATDNIFKDYALYYLGLYYWTHNNLDEAKKVWQGLIDEYRHEKAVPSPWAQLAEQKLPFIL